LKLSQQTLPDFLTRDKPYEIYDSDNYLVLDFETTNLDKGSAIHRGNRLLLTTYLSGRDEHLREDLLPVRHAWGDEFSQKELVEACYAADFLVAQNAKFELQWLSRMGVETHRLCVYDTMLGEYVRLGNRRGAKDLDSLCERYGVPTKNSLVKHLINGGVCPSDIPERWLEEYGIGDTRNTHQVFLRQREELRQLNLLPVLFTRCLATVVLADIEMQGVHADAKATKDEYESCKRQYDEAEARVHQVTGGINLNSPKQVAEFLYDKEGFAELLDRRTGEPDRTDAGGRRTDEDAICSLEAATDRQREVLQAFLAAKPLYKKLDSLTKLLGAVKEDDGIIYGNINQAVTQTHRTSSSGKKWKLQFQNFDRDLKPLFSSRHSGWLVGEADGSGLEFRGAGHLGNDSKIISDIREGVDPHLFSASVIYKTSESKVSKSQRTAAKAHTFKPLFGGMSGTEDEVRYYKAFRKKYHELYDAQTAWTYEVLRTGKLVTEWGLIFYWPDTKMSRSGYISNTTNIFNYPIQSFCTAEIIPISLVYFWHRARRLGLRLFLVNTVHDSIIAELPPDEEDIFRELSEKAFTEDVYSFLWRNYGIKMRIPLGCETKVGTHWGKGSERKYNREPEYGPETGDQQQDAGPMAGASEGIRT